MSSTTTSAIETTVVEALKTFGTNPAAISRGATWDAIDIDSLDLAEFAQIVEDAHGVVIEADDMRQLKTVGDAIDFITEKSAA